MILQKKLSSEVTRRRRWGHISKMEGSQRQITRVKR